jgi:hypothetical protein
MIKFVSSNSFAAKSVEQMRVEQSQFEQFTPTPLMKEQINHLKSKNQNQLLVYSITNNKFREYILKAVFLI